MMEDVGMQDVHFNEVSASAGAGCWLSEYFGAGRALRHHTRVFSWQRPATHFALTPLMLQTADAERRKSAILLSRISSFSLERGLEELV